MELRTRSPHGTHTRYTRGCKCDECRIAHRLYERQKKRERSREAQGIEDRVVKIIDASEVRKHILFLSSRGIGTLTIVKLSGLAQSNVLRIKRGEQKSITVASAKKILAIPALPVSDGHRVPSSKAQKLVDEMLATGLTETQINRLIGNREPRIIFKETVRLSRFRKFEELHKKVVKGKR